jgi:hypothetical protein
MKKLLLLSALIVYLFACCPCSTTSPPYSDGHRPTFARAPSANRYTFQII